jgi:hypothetical protein
MKDRQGEMQFDPNPMSKIDISLKQGFVSLIEDNRGKIAAGVVLGASAFLPHAVSAQGLVDTQPHTMDPHLKLKLWTSLTSGVVFGLKEVREASRGGDKRQIFTNFGAGAIAGFVAPDVIPDLVNHKPLDINTFSEISAFSISAAYIVKSTNFHLLLGEKVKGKVDAWKSNNDIQKQAHQISKLVEASKKMGRNGTEAWNSLGDNGFTSDDIRNLQRMRGDERRKQLEDILKQEAIQDNLEY